jgi:hypothetical protein
MLAWREWLGLVHHGLSSGKPNAFASSCEAPGGPALNVWSVSGRGLYTPQLAVKVLDRIQ